MPKKIFSLIICALILFSLSACGTIKGADAQLIFPIDKDPRFLDPQIISDPGAENIILNCFEGLVTLGENGELLPGMAEKWDISPDGKTYVFYLRQNSRWRVTSAAKKVLGGDEIQLYPTYNEKGKLVEPEEGKEIFNITVTAHDFDFGLTRALLPETKCPTAYKLYCIKNAEAVHSGALSQNELGIEALNDFTLKITLQNPDSDFLYALLDPACMPCNEIFFEKTGGRYGLATRYLIYNGPFYINNWADDASVSVRKNADYYYDSKNVMPYSVYFSINDEQNTRLRKLKNDTYDISPFTESQALEITKKKGYTVSGFESSVKALIFNCKDTYLQNADIRRALAATFDFDAYKADSGKPLATNIFPLDCYLGALPYSQLSKPANAYSSDNPQALLKSGLKAIEQNTATITLLCKSEDELTVRKLIQTWQAKLGVICNISVEPTDEATLNKKVKSGDYQLALTKINYSGNSFIDAALTFTSQSRNNILNFSSAGYDNAVKALANASSLSEKVSAAATVEKYLSKAAVIIPLSTEKIYQAHSNGVSGIIYNRTGDVLYFKNTLEK